MDKDVREKNCLSDNERYADLINGLLLEGEQIVKPEDLYELDTQLSAWKFWEKQQKQSYRLISRDMIRKVAFGVNFLLIGVENQQKVHYLAPMRMMSYDAASYEKQARIIRRKVKKMKNITGAEFLSGFRKEDKLLPCITIVLFYGGEWDGSKDLHGILDFTDIPEKLRKYVNNYPIHVFEIAKLERTEVFRTDLKQIFDFIRYAKDKKRLKELVQRDPAYQDMDEDAYDMVVAYTGAEELVSVKKNHESGGKVNMCLAIKEMLADERQEGLEQGRSTLLVEKVCKKLEKNKSREQIAEELEEDISIIHRICDVAEEVIPRYDVEKICERI